MNNALSPHIAMGGLGIFPPPVCVACIKRWHCAKGRPQHSVHNLFSPNSEDVSGAVTLCPECRTVRRFAELDTVRRKCADAKHEVARL